MITGLSTAGRSRLSLHLAQAATFPPVSSCPGVTPGTRDLPNPFLSKLRTLAVAERRMSERTGSVLRPFHEERTEDLVTQQHAWRADAHPFHPAVVAGVHSGRIFWFIRKKFSGSYVFFTLARRV